MLTATIHQVRTGQLDPRYANVVGYISTTLLTAFKNGEIEERLTKIEAMLESHKNKHQDKG